MVFGPSLLAPSRRTWPSALVPAAALQARTSAGPFGPQLVVNLQLPEQKTSSFVPVDETFGLSMRQHAVRVAPPLSLYS